MEYRKFSSIKRACNNGPSRRLSGLPKCKRNQGAPPQPSKAICPACSNLELGEPRSESLEQMVCPGHCRLFEVVPHVLPAEATERFVQLFRSEAFFKVVALDIVGRVEAISPGY